jgi:hypothetical protein
VRKSAAGISSWSYGGSVMCRQTPLFVTSSTKHRAPVARSWYRTPR